MEIDYDQLRTLIQALVFQFLANRNIDLTPTEKEKIRFKVTGSMTATEHFYRGIDFYDQGEYPEAFGEFLRAANQDSQFLEASLWVGKMLEAQEFYRHSILAYEKLYETFPQSIEGRDGLLFAAKILQLKLGDDEKAIQAFRKLTDIRPITPHSLQSSFELGDLLQNRGEHFEAYKEFQKVDDFRSEISLKPLSDLNSQTRTSRFFTWRGTLELYKESIVKMVALYPKMIAEMGQEELPPAPRGSILISREDPSHHEARYGHTESLFSHESRYENWDERLYVVLVPEGYVATGIDFSITGQMKELNIFTIQLLENHSKISDWSFQVQLAVEDPNGYQAEVPEPTPSEKFWEGQPLARIPLQVNKLAGATRLQQQIWYQPKKEMDLLHDPGTGYYLIVSQGELDGQQTDLFFAHSADGKQWPPLQALGINSSSEDFNPRLIRSEDGKIWLAWISTRRGKGWELMLSHLNEHNEWASPRRVPLERFSDLGMESRMGRLANVLLEFDIFQDNRGRWIIAYYSHDDQSMVLIRSSDAREWTLLSKIATGEVTYGAALIQDSSAVYRLGFLGEHGRLHLWSSRDGIRWDQRYFDIQFWNQGLTPGPRVHRMRLFPLEAGHLLLLVSDNQYGLQFARFHADSGEPVLDLVTRVGMEPYSVARTSDNRYIAALKEDEYITLRQYEKFNTSGEEIQKDTRNWPIYRETEGDVDGHTWTRIFAQMRRIVSDVTSLGLEANGRLWWGIESGIMYKQGDQFVATDVSQGFFYHFTTHIVSCSDQRVWFSSKYLNRPQLGFVQRPNLGTTSRLRSQTVWVPNLDGSITDMTCGGEASQILVSSDRGKIVGFDGQDTFLERSLPVQSHITALTYGKETDELWVGTQDDGLFLFQGNEQRRYNPSNSLVSNHVIDLTFDQQGTLWVGLHGGGLVRYRQGNWEQFTPENSDVQYWSVGHLAADPDQGVWYLPHDDVRSRGLGYFDGNTGRVFNPPHQTLASPSSLLVEPSGVIWVGTWYDGLYQLVREDVVQ
jgi:tetratricopeptide (TPR) repeat protein